MRRVILAMACCAVLTGGCGSSATSSAPGGSTAARTTSTAPAGPHLTVDATPSFAAPSPSAPVLKGLVRIAYRNFAIDPDVVRLKAGSTVEWQNFDPAPHNVTSEGGSQSFHSEDFGEGASFKLRLTRPGVIHYESTDHPASMNGTIQVLR